MRSSAAARAASLVAALVLAACRGETPEPRSVVVIVVDTLRADHLGAYGYAEHPTSPRLDAWFERGRVYERALATSPWTLPSIGSLLTGRWPVHHGGGQRTRERDRPGVPTPLRADLPTLAERFHAAGFRTAAIVNNAFLAPSFGAARGFEIYDFDASTLRGGRRTDFVGSGLAWLERREQQRSLLLLHLFDPHLSYDARPPFRGRFSAEIASRFALPVGKVADLRREAPTLAEPERRFVRAAYDEEIAAVDAQLGMLLDALEKRGFLKHSLVVLTADHGEELFEHAGFEHGHALWQELLHVPLVFWGVGVRPGRETAPVSLVDLAPTLLDATGLPPLAESDGISLWPNLTRGIPLSDRALYAEGLLYGPERKAVIRWPDKLEWAAASGEWRHFDLERDPGEVQPGSVAARPELEGLQRSASALWQLGKQPDPTPGAPAPVDAATRDALQALGYLE